MARQAKTEGQVWEVVNRERKKRKGVNEGIEMEEWIGYFNSLLGGEGRMVKGERDVRREEDMELDISREEVVRAVVKVKESKAMGGDEILGEVWKYGGERLLSFVWDSCNKIWKEGEGDRGLEQRGNNTDKEKGRGERVEHYRGVTLMPCIRPSLV